MSVQSDAVDGGQDLQRLLDQLIPPPTTSWRKLAVGVTLAVLAVVFTVANTGGYLYPRPTFGITYDSGGRLQADRSRGVVSAQVLLPNHGSRSVRITEVTLNAPGASLVEVGVIVDHHDNESSGSSSGAEPAVEVTVAEMFGLDRATPLPVIVEPGADARIVVWFRPEECIDPSPPWGIAVARLDFGDGAFPPISRTIEVDQDPIGSEEEATDIMVDGEWLTASGPLAAACEALR